MCKDYIKYCNGNVFYFYYTYFVFAFSVPMNGFMLFGALFINYKAEQPKGYSQWCITNITS